MKKVAGLFILIGIVFLTIGGYQYINNQMGEKKAHNEAKELLAASRSQDQVNHPKENIDTGEDTVDEVVIFEPEHGETVGLLEIDRIDASIPIIEGTDPDELKRGVGHMAQTAYPGEDDQIVLSGHRDTVFRRLGEVKVGDIIKVQLPHGTFEYEMVDSIIVSADDTSVVKSTAPNEELVISTCYPFRFVGNAPDRYVIYAVPVGK